MRIDLQGSTVRSRFALPHPALDGVPAVPPELSCLSLIFARSSDDLSVSHDRDAPSPAALLWFYRDLFRSIDEAYESAGRMLDRPSRLLEQGYYRLEVLAIATGKSNLVVRRAAATAAELERVFRLEPDERPDVFFFESEGPHTDGLAARRIDVRLVEARIT